MDTDVLKQFTEDWLGSDEFIKPLIAVRSQLFAAQDPLFLYDAISDFMNGAKSFTEFSKEIINNADDPAKKELALQTVLDQLLSPVKDTLIQYGIAFSAEPPIVTTTSQANPVKPEPLSVQITPAPTQIIPQITNALEKTDIIPQEKRETLVAATPQPSTSPYILHQETAFKSLAEEHNINYEPIKKAFFSTSQTPPPVFKAPTIPAKIQFGTYREEPKAQKNTAGKTEFFTPKIVHYSEFMTPVSPFGDQAAVPPSPTTPTIPGASRSESPKPETPTAKPLTPPTKFNDRVIQNQSQQPVLSSDSRKIDLKDLPL